MDPCSMAKDIRKAAGVEHQMRDEGRYSVAEDDRIAIANLAYGTLGYPPFGRIGRCRNERRARFTAKRRVITDARGLQGLRNDDHVIHKRAGNFHTVRVQTAGRNDLLYLRDDPAPAGARSGRLHES